LYTAQKSNSHYAPQEDGSFPHIVSVDYQCSSEGVGSISCFVVNILLLFVEFVRNFVLK